MLSLNTWTVSQTPELDILISLQFVLLTLLFIRTMCAIGNWQYRPIINCWLFPSVYKHMNHKKRAARHSNENSGVQTREWLIENKTQVQAETRPSTSMDMKISASENTVHISLMFLFSNVSLSILIFYSERPTSFQSHGHLCLLPHSTVLGAIEILDILSKWR